ncbi:MAG: GNAT family N-acetyltransferase [Pseudomonadota bacterium]
MIRLAAGQKAPDFTTKGFLPGKTESVNMRITWSWQSFDALAAADLYDILRLRQDVFILEQSSLYADIDGRDPEAWHLAGHSNDGRLAAYMRVFPVVAQAAETTLGRFVVAPWARGIGLARDMMDRCLGWVAGHAPEAPIRISAQAHLEAFYRGYGFAATGDAYDDAGVPHVDMIRAASGGGIP